MAKYMLIYRGQATDMSEMTPEQGAQILAKWNVWMARVGGALADIGTPFGPGTSLVDDGTVGSALSLTGYSIVEADDLDAALKLADGHPYLSEGKGNFSIEVYEQLPVPFEA
jgi:hypothetical protein